MKKEQYTKESEILYSSLSEGASAICIIIRTLRNTTLVWKHGDTELSLHAQPKYPEPTKDTWECQPYFPVITQNVEGERRAGKLWSIGRVCQNSSFISSVQQVTACCTCYVFWLSESFLKHFNISFFLLC